MTSLDPLPRPNTKRLAVRVTPDAGRNIMSGHPWVYDDSITSISTTASNRGAHGDLAVIFDKDREFMAIGLYDPSSVIRIKVLHRGRPTQIDTAFWRSRAEAAAVIRDDLRRSSETTTYTATGSTTRTTGYRCVNGENDGFPGLIADLYADTMVIKLYSAAWVPHLATLVPILATTFKAESVVLRLARSIEPRHLFGLTEGDLLWGTPPDQPVQFFENGLRFEADVANGQKTGFFLDQRDNRARLRLLISERSTGARVLDVFASTGAFSVYAAAGGASEVISVDSSAPTLAVAEQNMAHNVDDTNVARCNHTLEIGDAFELMDRFARQHRRFDVVIVDPPSFAQKQANVERAEHAYTQLTEKAVRLVDDGGLLVQASCSSRVTEDQFYRAVALGAANQSVRLDEIARTGHAVDHPVTFRQGAYLKALFATVHHEQRPKREPR